MPVPNRPWNPDSMRNIPMIVPRFAPMARSIPTSRRRSATTVRKLLRMMNPPVASAKTPNMLKAKDAMPNDAISVALFDRPPTW